MVLDLKMEFSVNVWMLFFTVIKITENFLAVFVEVRWHLSTVSLAADKYWINHMSLHFTK